MTSTDKTPDLGELVERVTAYADGFILNGGDDFAAIGRAIHDALTTLSAKTEALEKERATPELIALGEAAVKHYEAWADVTDFYQLDAAKSEIARAARAYAASVAPIPTTSGGR